MIKYVAVFVAFSIFSATSTVVSAQVSTIAGTGVHGSRDGEDPQFNMPSSVFQNLEGYLIVADTYNNLVRTLDINTGYAAKLAGSILEEYLGEDLGIDNFGFPIGFFRDGEPDGEEAFFHRPSGGVTLQDGRLLIADSKNNALRLIYEDGTVRTLSGGSEDVAQMHGYVDGSLQEALFHHPSALALGPYNIVYVADTLNHAIRMIDIDAGTVTTLAGGQQGFENGDLEDALFDSPMGIAVSQDGVVFVADTGNHKLRAIENGQVRTVAGSFVMASDVDWLNDDDGLWLDDSKIGGFEDGNGEAALFNLPKGLSLSHTEPDILIIADSGNHSIRRVTLNGSVTTIAGSGEPGHEDGPIYEARFHFPSGVLSLENGDIIVADTGNNQIRLIQLLIQ